VKVVVNELESINDSNYQLILIIIVYIK